MDFKETRRLVHLGETKVLFGTTFRRLLAKRNRRRVSNVVILHWHILPAFLSPLRFNINTKSFEPASASTC